MPSSTRRMVHRSLCHLSMALGRPIVRPSGLFTRQTEFPHPNWSRFHFFGTNEFVSLSKIPLGSRSALDKPRLFPE